MLRKLSEDRIPITLENQNLCADQHWGIECCRNYIAVDTAFSKGWAFNIFHRNAHRIYRAYTKEDFGAQEKFFNTNIPFPLGQALKENFHEVEHVVRFSKINRQVKVEQQQFSVYVTIVSKIFSNYDFPLLKGDKRVLEQPSHVVLTREISKKYFGTANPVNKLIPI